MRISTSPKFNREAKKLPKDVQNALKERLQIFITDPFAPSLRTHKTSGKIKDHWSFLVTYDYRAFFRYDDEGDIVLVTVGKHDDVY